MKKLLFIGLAATAMLAGCSNDEIVEMPQQKAIGFSSFVNKSTRGLENDITNDNLENFQVWGLMNKDDQTGKPFVGTTVSKSNGAWSYGTPVYWENGYKYSFVAIAPAAVEGNWKFTAPTTVGQWGSIAFNNGDGTTDLIYDVDGTWATEAVSTAETCPSAINFTFNHLLSRVKFTFVNELADESTINVTDVKITNANMKATAALGETVTWTLAADNTPAELAFGNVLLGDGEQNFVMGENGTKATDHKYMIPALAENQAYEVKFTVTREHSGITDTYNHTVTIPAANCVFEAGKSYNFIATLKAENVNPDAQLCEIQFTARVSDWGNFSGDTELLPEETTSAE